VPDRRTQIDVLLEQALQTEVLGQRGRVDQPGVRHQMLIIEGHADGVEAVR